MWIVKKTNNLSSSTIIALLSLTKYKKIIIGDDKRLNVTGRVKTGHICTQNLANFFNLNLPYVLTYSSKLNETFVTYYYVN